MTVVPDPSFSYRRPRTGNDQSPPRQPSGASQWRRSARGRPSGRRHVCVSFIGAAGIASWSPRLTGRGKREGHSCRCLASPQVQRLLDVIHLDGILPAAQRQVAPSLRAAPPDGLRASAQGRGTLWFRPPA